MATNMDIEVVTVTMIQSCIKLFQNGTVAFPSVVAKQGLNTTEPTEEVLATQLNVPDPPQRMAQVNQETPGPIRSLTTIRTSSVYSSAFSFKECDRVEGSETHPDSYRDQIKPSGGHQHILEQMISASPVDDLIGRTQLCSARACLLALIEQALCFHDYLFLWIRLDITGTCRTCSSWACAHHYQRDPVIVALVRAEAAEMSFSSAHP
ncbi:hypothetical protein HOY80DRAFT_1056936 [Tuber brumale]|nr:hypothetical protein HOY80DRAFT_1056936 [Tuber brumale]